MGTGYRPPSTEPKGRWAKHIHAKRREWGWSQTRGFEAVREGLGLSEKSRAAYISLDMGPRVPTPSEEQALAAVYGWPPESPTEALERPTTGEGSEAIAEAIREQTGVIRAQGEAILTLARAIQAQVDELASYRREAARGRIVEKSLIEALPAALASALSALPVATQGSGPLAGLGRRAR